MKRLAFALYLTAFPAMSQQEIEYRAAPMPMYQTSRAPSLTWLSGPQRLMAIVSPTGEVRIDWEAVEEVLRMDPQVGTPHWSAGNQDQLRTYAMMLKAARQGTWQQLP